MSDSLIVAVLQLPGHCINEVLIETSGEPWYKNLKAVTSIVLEVPKKKMIKVIPYCQLAIKSITVAIPIEI